MYPPVPIGIVSCRTRVWWRQKYSYSISINESAQNIKWFLKKNEKFGGFSAVIADCAEKTQRKFQNFKKTFKIPLDKPKKKWYDIQAVMRV